MRKIAIFGATSAIVSEAARCFARDGDSFLLIARNPEKLDAVKKDLEAQGAKAVESIISDLGDKLLHGELFLEIEKKFPDYDTVLIGYGTLGDQKAAEADFLAAEKELSTNFSSVVSLLTRVANTFEEKQQGTIAVITSVAGDRGRQSNYVYGTAKGALTIFLQGLRNRLQKSQVAVVTIKPGFVDTPMTAALDKGPLYVKPNVVGEGIYKAIVKRKNVVYLPWFWRHIMLIIRHIPEVVFKRLGL